MRNILVIGSSNTDMVVKVDRFPTPGETLLGGEFFMFPGGKGANQAVAAARMGARVRFITKTGNDVFGRQALEGFHREGILTDHCLIDPERASGVALIAVNAAGENQIVVASGANSAMLPAHLFSADTAFEASDIVLVQLEIPLETILFIKEKCRIFGKPLILNPAPAQALPESLLRGLFLITPNETEAEILTGIKYQQESDLPATAEVLRSKGVENVLITLGAKGAYLYNDEYQTLIPAEAVQAVDTTAAGDIFNGALAVGLAEGLDWLAAVRRAGRAAAISVTRMGAQTSAPYRAEVD